MAEESVTAVPESTPPAQQSQSPDILGAAAIAAEPAEAAPRPRGKRGVSNTALFSGALALGVIGGLAAGYTVQALRAPTPLPPLRVAAPVYPPSPVYLGVAPAPLPPDQDDASIVDGDLRKLLPAKPAGAADWRDTPFSNGWTSLIDFARPFDAADQQFTKMNEEHFLRAAGTAWTQGGGLQVQLEIIQFAPGGNASRDLARRGGSYDPTQPGIDHYVWDQARTDGTYESSAFAVHGDVEVVVWLWHPGSAPDLTTGVNLVKEELTKL